MDNDLHRLGLKLKFAYSIVGLLLGLACLIVGLVLGLSGVVGHTSLAASVVGLSTTVNDAAPGVVVFIVGIFMVWITRFKVSAGRETEIVPTREGFDETHDRFINKATRVRENIQYSQE